ncbi:MAG: hypothetical protein AAGA54_07455 [Myxococcota bacterium]
MRLPLLCCVWVVSACSSPAPEASPAPKAGAPAFDDAQAKAEPAADAKADEAKGDAKTPPPLSEEDKKLLAMDPADLTPELRRKRAYARRRQIMQNPDSPQARMLNDLQDAYKRGEMGNDGSGTPTFTLDGMKPGGAPPAGTRPAGTPAE